MEKGVAPIQRTATSNTPPAYRRHCSRCCGRSCATSDSRMPICRVSSCSPMKTLSGATYPISTCKQSGRMSWMRSIDARSPLGEHIKRSRAPAHLSDLALQVERQLLRLGQELRHARHPASIFLSLPPSLLYCDESQFQPPTGSPWCDAAGLFVGRPAKQARGRWNAGQRAPTAEEALSACGGD